MKHFRKHIILKHIIFTPIISIALCFVLLFMPVLASDGMPASYSESSSKSTSGPTSESAPESDAEPTSEAAVNTSSSKQAVFKIDNQNVYSGMDESYHNGYTPEIKNDTAVVILPLTANRSLKDDQLTASLNLGERTDNPFLYKNYRKTFSLSSQKMKGSDEKKEIYYIRFDLPLSSSRINGVYPVGISVDAEDADGNEISEEFTVYVTITDGKEPAGGNHGNSQGGNNQDNPSSGKDNNSGGNDYNNNNNNSNGNDIDGDDDNNSGDDYNTGDDGYTGGDDYNDDMIQGGNDTGEGGNGDGDAAEEKPSSQPIILVSKSTCKPAAATAGEPFQVVVTLTNTSKEKAVQNMVISVSCESSDLTLLNDTNTIYVEKLGKGASIDITLNYQAEKNITDGKYTINLSISYDNTDAVSLSSSGSVTVSVKQPLSVQMTMPQIASSATAGDTLPLSFQVMNLGRSKIYNVRCEISGDGLYPMSTAFIGDMEPGTSGESSMNLFIGSKSDNTNEQTNDSDEETDSGSNDSLYGGTEGTVTLIYEDTDGKEYKETQTFYLNIEKPIIQTSNTDDTETQEKASQWWISILIAGGLLAAAGIALFFIKRKHLGEIS